MSITFIELPLAIAEGVQTLALIADLPGAGTLIGTTYFVLEDDSLYVRNATTWVSVALT